MDIAPDVEHILLVVTLETGSVTSRPRINVVQSWCEELKARTAHVRSTSATGPG
jgi:hypothetical protein